MEVDEKFAHLRKYVSELAPYVTSVFRELLDLCQEYQYHIRKIITVLTEIACVLLIPAHRRGCTLKGHIQIFWIESAKRTCAICRVCVSEITWLMSRVSVLYQENYHGLGRDSRCTPHLRSQERLNLERLQPDFLIKRISSTCYLRHVSGKFS